MTTGGRMTGKKTAALHRSNLADQVLKSLMDWIMDGTLQMGDRLRTERISEELGVSRMPVREALNTLVRKGIAISEPYVGVRLVDLKREEIIEIYRLRRLLESEAAYYACANITPQALEDIQEILDKYQDVLLTPPMNAKEIHLINREFHFSIFAISGMKRTCDMIEGLWDVLSFFKMLYGETLLVTPEGKRKMIAEHQSYVDFLRAGDAGGLREATKRNIENKLERYLNSFGSSEAAPPESIKA